MNFVMHFTAWNVSKYGVFSGPYLDTFTQWIALRYNRDMSNSPFKCPCGNNVDVNHAMNCKKGGFVSIRHNNRDFEVKNCLYFEFLVLKFICLWLY